MDRERERVIEGGARATALLNAIGKELTEHENKVISRAIAAYRSNTLSPEQALAYLAEISSSRKLIETLVDKERQGNKAREGVYSNG